MKQQLLFLLFILFCHSALNAQFYLYAPNYEDSMQKLLQRPVADSTKARLHFELAAYWMSKDSLKTKDHIAAGRKLSKGNVLLTQYANSTEGFYYYNQGNLDRCIALFEEVEKGLSPLTMPVAYRLRSNAWSVRAVVLQREDDDKGYVNLMLSKAIPLAVRSKDSALLATQYTGVGVAFMNLEQHEKAEEYFDRAIPILAGLNSESRLIAVYKRSGENYVLLKKWDKVKATLEQFKKILFRYPESDQYAGYYMIEGLYLQHQKAYAAAIASYNKGIGKASGPNKIYEIGELNFYKLRCYMEMGDHPNALKVLNQLAGDADNMDMDQNRLEVYQKYAVVYAGLGRSDSAYYYQRLYSNLSDSLHENHFKADINELEAKYKTAEAAKQVAALKAEKAQAALKANQTRTFNLVLGSICLLLLLIAAFSYFYYWNNKKLLKQEAINHRQQLKEMEQKQQITITRSIMEGEERERERVARDLHDGLGGLLSGVKINFSTWAKNNLVQQPNEPFYKIMGQLDQSVGELRRVARNLMPHSLLKFGLETALKDLCAFYIKDGVHIEFEAIDIDPAIERSAQLHIYRIAQELLSNAVKHSRATRILLQCSQYENRFFMTVEDDGIGYDSSSSNGSGLGVNTVTDRVQYLKGIIETQTAPGNGTVVNIELNL